MQHLELLVGCGDRTVGNEDVDQNGYRGCGAESGYEGF